MKGIAKEVQRVISLVNVRAALVSSLTTKSLWDAVCAKFGAAPVRWPLWENLIDSEGVQLVDGWKQLNRYLEDEPAYLLFEPRDESQGFEFNSASAIIAIIDESFRFEFYITDRALSYLACFNHHDFLIGAGRACQWVIELKEDIASGRLLIANGRAGD